MRGFFWLFQSHKLRQHCIEGISVNNNKKSVPFATTDSIRTETCVVTKRNWVITWSQNQSTMESESKLTHLSSHNDSSSMTNTLITYIQSSLIHNDHSHHSSNDMSSSSPVLEFLKLFLLKINTVWIRVENLAWPPARSYSSS